MIADRKAGDAIDGIGNDAGTGRKLRHQHAMRIGFSAEARLDLRHRLRMAHKRDAQRRRSGLPRVVVGCGADAAETEQQVAARKGIAQQRGETLAVVAQVVDEVRCKTAHRQCFDDVRQMLVGALARQDLVPDDQCADVHLSFRGATS